MSEQSAAVTKGQAYLSNEDKRYGIIRTVTIERAVMAKRVYDAKKQAYAVGVSRIDAHEHRPELVGKKRRVFIKVARLLSSEYSLVTPLTVHVAEPHDIAPDTACAKHAPRLSSAAIAESLADAGLETVPGQ